MSFAAILSRATLLQTKPAMVLVEALVAAGVIAVVAGLFLMVLSDAGLAVGTSRERARQFMIAAQVLEEARAMGPAAPNAGETLGHPWKLECALSSTATSRLLDLILCRVSVQPRRGDLHSVTLQTAFAVRKGAYVQP
jgi:type II secretory pathway pseudopilin PulG